ncbi:MAG: universal stress protein [Thainema sp.]
MLNAVLVALDGSELSESIVAMLNMLKLPPEAKVVLAHVLPTDNQDLEQSADRPQSDSSEPLYRQAERTLGEYQEQIGHPSELEVVNGDPAEEIIRLANIYHADLIIIGSRGLTGMNRILQGSVSGQVVTDAPCSVLVVKPR